MRQEPGWSKTWWMNLRGSAYSKPGTSGMRQKVRGSSRQPYRYRASLVPSGPLYVFIITSSLELASVVHAGMFQDLHFLHSVSLTRFLLEFILLYLSNIHPDLFDIFPLFRPLPFPAEFFCQTLRKSQKYNNCSVRPFKKGTIRTRENLPVSSFIHNNFKITS